MANNGQNEMPKGSAESEETMAEWISDASLAEIIFCLDDFF